MTRTPASLYLAVMLLGGGQSAAPGAGPLSPDSPLAANRSWIFAVAEDQRTILRQSLADEGPWRPLPSALELTRATGLTATDDTLYVADGPAHRVMSVDLATNEVKTYASVPSTVEPADLAFTKSLYFTDLRWPTVYELSAGGDPRALAEPFGGPTSSKRLASNGKYLLMSSADDGAVWQATSPEAAGRGENSAWQAVQRPSPSRPGPDLPYHIDILMPRQVSFPLRPSAVTSNGGVIYVVDGNTNAIFGYSRYWPRPVRLQFGPRPVSTPSRIAATADKLLILDSARGAVVRWPRFVPTRVTCAVTVTENATPGEAPCVKSQSGELAKFFRYLNEEQYLPTRPLAATGELSAVTMRNAMRAIVCGLQETSCGSETGPLPTAPAPDVYTESYVDVARVRLNGKPLGRLADEAVPSPQFAGYVAEEKLAELNASMKTAAGTKYRNLTEGIASVPIELVRVVVGIPEQSIGLMAERFRSLSFVPLGEGPAARAAGGAGQPTDVERIKAANRELQIHTGGAFTVSAEKLPYIGVAESKIETTNPDLADSFGVMVPVHAATAAAAPPSVVIRPFTDDDHGTAVASLIAGRPTAFESPALAVGALLVAISDSQQQIGESIRDAYVNQKTRIFNLSFHFGKGNVPLALKEKVEQYTDVLFVVAAGNQTVSASDGNVCTTFEAYPVCWGDRQNVLVVTASTLDGSGMVLPDTSKNPPEPGANWNATIVHVAAPGEGYYAAGLGNSYVPVRGSSFSTPIVTATAALLYAQGVRSPWEIKQRILTTADRVAGLDGRTAYGLLNARRAVTNLSFAVVKDSLNHEIPLAPHDVGTAIKFSTATQDVYVPLSNIRRLTRVATGKSSLVYLDTAGQLQRLEVLEASWPFRYFELDAQKRHKGAVRSGDLRDYIDYVGPIM